MNVRNTVVDYTYVHVCRMKECVISTSYIPVAPAWTDHEVFKGKDRDNIHSQDCCFE